MGWWFTTGVQGVADIAREACTGGAMIHNPTFCVQAASARAGINAFIVDASPVARTLAIHYALRSTFNIGVAVVLRDTRTGACAIALFAKGISTARRRSTGSFGFVED